VGHGYAHPFPVVMSGLLRAVSRQDDGPLPRPSQGLNKYSGTTWPTGRFVSY